jgi:hypothetical protein
MKVFFKGYKEGMKEFGETISIVVNSILLSVVYNLGVGITKIFSKIRNKEFLELKKSNQETYWSDLNLKKQSLKESYKQS